MTDEIEINDARLRCSGCKGTTFHLDMTIYDREITPVCTNCGGRAMMTLLVQMPPPEKGDRDAKREWVMR
jgi:rRNA maturation endonuclease Nob1